MNIDLSFSSLLALCITTVVVVYINNLSNKVYLKRKRHDNPNTLTKKGRA